MTVTVETCDRDRRLKVTVTVDTCDRDRRLKVTVTADTCDRDRRLVTQSDRDRRHMWLAQIYFIFNKTV